MTSAAEHLRPSRPTAKRSSMRLPNPVLLVAPDGKIVDANMAAESFFEISTQFLQRQSLKELVPFGSPLLALIDQVRASGSPVNEYKVDLGTPRIGGDRQVDLHVAPLTERPGHIVVMLQERTIADKMDRQLTHRSAARSVIALAAMLAHEIKNPLSGIRGAAQLLEQAASSEDRMLTRLICDEADRIVTLVDRMEVFGDDRPVARGPVNIHSRARSRQAAGAIRLRPQYPLRRGIRSVAAAGARQPGSVDPGVSQSGEERRRSGRRSRQRCGNPAHHRVSSGRSAVGAGQEIAGVAAAGILRQGQRSGRAGGSSAEPVRSVRHDQSRPAAGSALRWSPKSSAIMAASSNANPSRGKPFSACCCRCSTPPNISIKAIAMTFRVRRRMPHRTQDED